MALGTHDRQTTLCESHAGLPLRGLMYLLLLGELGLGKLKKVQDQDTTREGFSVAGGTQDHGKGGMSSGQGG